MNVEQLLSVLEANADSTLQIKLPSGEFVPRHFHITEIGRIDKNFIDCGGSQHQSASCLLQAWTANDLDHQLVAGKLAKIFRMAEPILQSAELPVEVEYGVDVAAQFMVSDVEVGANKLIFVLSGKQTDCLAKEQCGLEICSAPGCCS